MSEPADSRILLIVAGGIAAYKTPELVRRLRDRGHAVRCVLTRGGAQFVSALTLAAVSEDKVYEDLFSLTDEAAMGHIRLSREADLLLVAPATADLLAKMTAGLADDLASTVLLATDKPVLVAPAMNVRMWTHPATQANIATLRDRGVGILGPEEGPMACGEWGPGRMTDVPALVEAVAAFFARRDATRPLAGRRVVVTSGPTAEPLDPVRLLTNRSSGKQGHAIAAAFAELGADVTLVSGPVCIPAPAGVRTVQVETARDMLAASLAALPADIVVCAAAVADWRPVEAAAQKLKKEGGGPPVITMVENPDILATIAAPGPQRPRLVVGFAAETERVLEHAAAKLRRKGCDFIFANDVSDGTGTFGGDSNTVHLVSADGVESWPTGTKAAIARRLAARLAEELTARAGQGEGAPTRQVVEAGR